MSSKLCHLVCKNDWRMGRVLSICKEICLETFLIKWTRIGHFRVGFYFCVKTMSLWRNNSYKNVFRPEPVHLDVNQIQFHMKDFERGLALKPRHRITRKWPTDKQKIRIIEIWTICVSLCDISYL